MPTEIFIGRNEDLMRQNYGDNVYIISEDCNTVSSPHAKLTIYENGLWMLEDLNSMNGTYVRNDKGEFVRVSNIQVTPDTIIRFGVAGHMSHTCWASHIKSWHEGYRGAQENYFYEFDRLLHIAANYNSDVSKLEAKIKWINWIPLITSFIATIAMVIWMYNSKYDMKLMIVRMALIPTVQLLTKIVINFFNYTEKLKALQKKRTWYLSCPKCGLPLTDIELDNRKCNKCRAH